MHEEIIQSFTEQNHIDILKIVDITSLTLEENRGYPYAILLIKALPKEYIEKLNQKKETDYTIFVNYENKTDELADKLIAVIQKEGYKAISQSENGIDICPVQAIYGRKWESGISRDDIVDVYRCVTCLKCLSGCRYSIIYSRS